MWSGTLWICLCLTATPNFDAEIVPQLTKAGCNSGACHGAAAGRGGFHLSLLGADPAADYDAITWSREGRRLDLSQPSRSLLLLKPLGELEHGGGTVLEEDSAAHRQLQEWITAGAPREVSLPVVSLRIEPPEANLRQPDTTISLRVVAMDSEDNEQDVTELATITAPDGYALHVLPAGQVHVQRRGQHVVIARYRNQVVSAQVNVPFTPPSDGGAAGLAPVDSKAHWIDQEIDRSLRTLGLTPSPPASDGTFLRRAFLDLAGRLPTPEETVAFLQDVEVDKRRRLVDTLLASDSFVDIWTLRWARWLRLHRLPQEPAAAEAYGAWLRGMVADDRSWRQGAHELLTATGDSHQVGAANFGRMVPDARAQAELVGQVFLGARIGCAHCHAHPLDRWTQDDYHGLAAVFARLTRTRDVRWERFGGVTNLRTGEPAVPRIPGVRDLDFMPEVDAPPGEHSDRPRPDDASFSNLPSDPRHTFAAWLTEEDPRPFARALANRIWREMFGRGLVEPVDDLRTTNPATHPRLLERLADELIQVDLRMRPLVRQIALSQTYARSAAVQEGNGMDDRFYARALVRPLPPEVLADAISDVTGVRDSYPDHPPNARAVHVLDPLTPAPSLDILGRCSRADACDLSVVGSQTLATQLHLLNGPLINAKLSSPDGRLPQMLDQQIPFERMLTTWYLTGLSRYPTDDELAHWRTLLTASDEPATDGSQSPASSPHAVKHLWQDFLWSMLNSQEFRTNH